jgi:hypothetical protein
MSALPQSTLGRRLAIAGLFVLALLLAWIVWAAVVANSFFGRVAAIRAAGDPASIADLKPKPIPPEQDAAAHLAEAKSQIDAFARDHGRFFKTPVGKSYDDRKRGEPLTPEQLAAIRAILDRYPEIDDAVQRAAACDGYAPRHDFSLPHSKFLATLPPMENRIVARYVGWQIETAIAEGRHEDALQDGIALLRLSRLMQAEPGLVGGMVAVAIHGVAAQATYDALNAGPVPAALHEALDGELARQDNLQPFTRIMKSERAIVISGLQEEFRGVRGLVLNTLGRPLKMQYTATLDLFDDVLQDAKVPWHILAAKWPTSAIRKSPTGHGVFADLMQPSIHNAYEAANRSLAVSRSLRVANALRRFAAENGREATSLAELSLPAAATIDQFSGNPLLWKRQDGAWIVYSIRGDGKDDGGVSPNDYGVGLREEPR